MFAPRLDVTVRKPMRGVRERFGKMLTPFNRVCIFVLAGSLFGISPLATLSAQDSQTKKFSPQVVAKAEKILEDIGLKRSGKTITSKNTVDVSRALTSLTRERRKLKLVYQEWKKASDVAAKIRNTIKQLTVQDAELNVQLARVSPGDVTSNNRIVALINAARAQSKLLGEQEGKAKEAVAQRRQELSEAESKYAETIIAIRKDFNAARDAITESLTGKDAKIALKVMHANFETPADVTAAVILKSLEVRLERVEQEVFSEAIKLDVQPNGSMYVDVVVGTSTTRMVVDSGASLISIPMKTAVALGIKVPLDARELRLVMADGRSIGAKAITLPRVRVGEFEAENVAAAVLDETAIGAEPLLGMSYLGNFKFEIDSNEKTLKMLRVATK